MSVSVFGNGNAGLVGGGSGAAGADGFPGGYTFKMTFRTGTSPSASTGEFKYNNATVASVTALYSAKTDRSSVSLTAVLNSVVANDLIKLWVVSDQTKWAIYKVTASTDNTTYQTFTVTHVASNSTFSDTSVIAFSICKAGPTGASGGALGSTPTITAGTGAGTPGPIVIDANSDTKAGGFSIVTGGSPATDATIVTVTFSSALAAAPKSVIISPANKVTRNLAINQQPFVLFSDVLAASFKITSNTTALGTTTYRWYYSVDPT